MSGKIESSKKLHEDWCEEVVEDGLVPARAWREQAVGIVLAERMKLRWQMAAAAAGKEESVSLSLFTEVKNFEVVEELSTLATLALGGEGVWLGKWRKEQLKAWRKQIFEVQTWRQVRRPAGPVMCETLDLGITWRST